MAIPFTDPAKDQYVDNQEFSAAIREYSILNKKNKTLNLETRIPEYIGLCIIKISEGLSLMPNFSHYPFRDEMVLDAIENCIRSVKNYDISTPTRTGKPNAFSYFTQIAFYAFLRRIAKEKRQNELKEKMIDNSGGSLCFTESEHSDGHNEDYIMEHAKTKHDDFMMDRPKKKKKGFHKPVKVEALENFM